MNQKETNQYFTETGGVIMEDGSVVPMVSDTDVMIIGISFFILLIGMPTAMYIALRMTGA